MVYSLFQIRYGVAAQVVEVQQVLLAPLAQQGGML